MTTQYKSDIPIVDLTPLLAVAENDQAIKKCAQQIAHSCRKDGFFYITEHGVDPRLQEKLEELSRSFFKLPEDEKLKIAMPKAGQAWRGYFPVGNELTSGKPDQKEGLYFGSELSAAHPKVKAKTPLHGANLFPEYPAALKQTVLDYLSALEKVGQVLMKGIALSFGLNAGYFKAKYTYDPFLLFRIFHYPAQKSNAENWGVGEHTDYGLLTILKQDEIGGLQIKSKGQWIDAPPVENSFICNIGDMLDKMTGGLYKSTPHRVKNTSGQSRLSFPFFFDPAFDAKIERIVNHNPAQDDFQQRWDQSDIYAFEGTYGDYLMGKVSKVFPDLRKRNF